MKNILLAASGLSPQVITEALYALWHQGRPISRLEIITTRTGKERILAGLFSPMDGKLLAFMQEFGIPENDIEFGPHLIHVLKDETGNELDDIITPKDNKILLQTCIDLAYQLTSDPDSAVFFLVAGGRKTMTSCLTLAAQIYGRPQDRIYHVLVTPEFEQCRDFWYPPKISKNIAVRNNNGIEYVINTKYAKIELISIPFISIRKHLDPKMLSHPISPSELSDLAIYDKEPAIILHLSNATISYHNKILHMFPIHMAIYAFFVQQKVKCKNTHTCKYCTDCFLDKEAIFSKEDEIKEIYLKIKQNIDFS
ncbi:MAG: CRISPR-associated ring nuclease Csm6, partial [Dissulfurimicrobium sp.]